MEHMETCKQTLGLSFFPFPPGFRVPSTLPERQCEQSMAKCPHFIMDHDYGYLMSL